MDLTVLDRPARHLACVVLAAALLTGCGGGDGSAEEPRPTPTRSVDLPSPTRTAPTDESEPAEPDRTRDTTRPSPTLPDRTEDTEAPTPDETEEPAERTVTLLPSPEPTTEPTDAATASTASEPAEGDDSTPAWVWWLLAALLVAALATGLVIWSRARRRRRWLADYEEVEGEVAWFARTLLPDLRRSASLEGVVGGWQVASPRVAAAEDRLTVLGPSAPTEADVDRARTLRDAVRLAAQRLDALAVVAPHDTWALDLDEVAADLEVALGPATPPAT